MQLTITVPDDIVRDVATLAVTRAFLTGSYNDRGLGVARVEDAVKQAVLATDFAPQVRELLAARLPALVADVAADELRRAVAAEVRRMKASGQLATMVRDECARQGALL